MSLTKPVPRKEASCVDEVRRVRERLSEETGNEVHRLADHAQRITEQLKDELGLKTLKA